MTRNWNYQDIIDLEYFFQQDSDTTSSALHARDRQIYLDHAKSQAESETEEMATDGPSLLAIWLAARRETNILNDALPGTIAHEAHALLRLTLIFFGLFSGGSAGLIFFSYSGITPVNVLHFLVLFVFSQLLMTLLLLARATLLQLGLRSLPGTLTIRAMAALSTRLISILQRQGNMSLSANKRLALQAVYGKLKAANSTYPTALYWPLFQMVQLTAVCCNLGLLGAFFFKVVVSDVAFGWQSTLQFSSQSLHTVVSWIALPWSWLLPEGTAYPTLQEVEGSRIILKEGIANLQTPDLISWWPFLLLCVLAYGLLLRLALFGYGWFREAKVSSNLEFSTPAARQVLRRMQTPLVSTQARPEPLTQTGGRTIGPKMAAEPSPLNIDLHPIFLLLPDEIFEQCSNNDLDNVLAREGYQIQNTKRFMVDYESDQQILSDLTTYNWSDSAGIVIIVEAWMPPLISFQTFIQEMRKNVGERLPIMLRLVGKASATTPLTPVNDTTLRRIWRQKMESLGDAYLETGDLIEEEPA